MKRFILWPFVLCLLIAPSSSWASKKILFEGYYKVLLQAQHVGYYIQRYEIDSKKKQFISTHFLRTNKKGGDIRESLQATATQSLNPIAYQYTSLQGKKATTIDGKVTKGKMVLKITENGRLRVTERKVQPGVFFSTFLIYLVLQGKQGVQPGVKYDFKAIAEEDGKTYPGNIFIEKEEKYNNAITYKSLYTFKKSQFINYINSKGESLKSFNPALALSAELVGNPTLATQSHIVNENNLKLLFGNLPTGSVNELAKKPTTPTPKKTKGNE